MFSNGVLVINVEVYLSTVDEPQQKKGRKKIIILFGKTSGVQEITLRKINLKIRWRNTFNFFGTTIENTRKSSSFRSCEYRRTNRRLQSLTAQFAYKKKRKNMPNKEGERKKLSSRSTEHFKNKGVPKGTSPLPFTLEETFFWY